MMGRSTEILHDEICARLDKIIGLLEKNNKCQLSVSTSAWKCRCIFSYPVDTAGCCTNCGYPKN